MNLTHKEHIKVNGYANLLTGELRPFCETCTTVGHFVPWDQIHQDWEALRDELADIHKNYHLTPIQRGGSELNDALVDIARTGNYVALPEWQAQYLRESWTPASDIERTK